MVFQEKVESETLLVKTGSTNKKKKYYINLPSYNTLSQARK